MPTQEETQMIKLDIKKQKINYKLKISVETSNEIFYNIIFAIIIMLYNNLLILANTTMIAERLEKDIQVFAGIFMIIGILFMEKAYNQEKGNRVMTALECFILSFHSLSIVYIIKKYNFDFAIYLGASTYIFASYCILKAIIIYTKGRKQILENLSDVKEIVQKEEPIKKEATKRIKEEKEEQSSKPQTKKNTTRKASTKKANSGKTQSTKKNSKATSKTVGKNEETKKTSNGTKTSKAKKASTTKKKTAKKEVK